MCRRGEGDSAPPQASPPPPRGRARGACRAGTCLTPRGSAPAWPSPAPLFLRPGCAPGEAARGQGLSWPPWGCPAHRWGLAHSGTLGVHVHPGSCGAAVATGLVSGPGCDCAPGLLPAPAVALAHSAAGRPSVRHLFSVMGACLGKACAVCGNDGGTWTRVRAASGPSVGHESSAGLGPAGRGSGGLLPPEPSAPACSGRSRPGVGLGIGAPVHWDLQLLLFPSIQPFYFYL